MRTTAMLVAKCLLGCALIGSCARPVDDGRAAGQLGIDGSGGRTQAAPRAEPVEGDQASEFSGTSMDDIARYLAGMPGLPGPYRDEPAWAAHTAQLDELWRRFDTLRRWPIQSWGNGELGGLRSAGTVFYPFGGPDFLYADAFFPSARQYVLCGLESAEPLPPLGGLSAEQRAEALATLSTALTSSLSFSFFITKDMKSDLQRSELKGVLPIMLVFLARGGHPIHSVEAIALDPAGQVVARAGGTPGFRIRFGAGRTLYYFTTDLSNGGFNDSSRMARFVRSLGPSVGFTKSASYLMHEPYFSNIRDFMLGWCAAVLQDDSGIPYRHLATDQWNVRLYGRYSGVLGIFSKYYQTDLAAADALGADPLGFGIGYKHNEGQSVMILARRRGIR